MPSCQFENLPLRHASVQIRYDVPIPWDFGLLSDLISSLLGDFPDVHRFRAGVSPHQFSFSVNDHPGCSLKNAAQSLAFEAQQQVIEVAWFESKGATYPGYAMLKSLLVKAADVINIPHRVAICNYIVSGQEGDRVHEYFAPRGISVESMQNLVEINLAQMLPNAGIEHRIQIPPPQNDTYVIITTGGLISQVTDTQGFSRGIFESELDKVHDAMQEEFASMLLPKARKNYGFTGIS